LIDYFSICAVCYASRGCSHLESVNISWCCLVTDDGVRHLASKCTNIQYFICKGCIKVSIVVVVIVLLLLLVVVVVVDVVVVIVVVVFDILPQSALTFSTFSVKAASR